MLHTTHPTSDVPANAALHNGHPRQVQRTEMNALHSIGRNANASHVRVGTVPQHAKTITPDRSMVHAYAQQYSHLDPRSPSSRFVYPSLQVSKAPANLTLPDFSENVKNANCDDKSEVSSLACGSIMPDPAYNPANDPILHFKQFVPPTIITTQSKVEMPEVPEWLQLDERKPLEHPPVVKPQLLRGKTEPNSYTSTPRRADLQRQISWTSRGDFTPERTCPAMTTPVASPDHLYHPSMSPLKLSRSHESGVTPTTTPTHCSSEDEIDVSKEQLETVPERSPIRTKNPFGGRLSMFPKPRARRKSVNLQRSQGCLT